MLQLTTFLQLVQELGLYIVLIRVIMKVLGFLRKLQEQMEVEMPRIQRDIRLVKIFSVVIVLTMITTTVI